MIVGGDVVALRGLVEFGQCEIERGHLGAAELYLVGGHLLWPLRELAWFVWTRLIGNDAWFPEERVSADASWVFYRNSQAPRTSNASIARIMSVELIVDSGRHQGK